MPVSAYPSSPLLRSSHNPHTPIYIFRITNILGICICKYYLAVAVADLFLNNRRAATATVRRWSAMCIAAWAWQCHPMHHLLLLFNRDEYHSRPTQPVQWWAPGEDSKEILGGRDELGGGTWMGCTRDGKLAFLTNVREPGSLIGAKTRGHLPVRFLQGRLGPLEYATEIAKEADQYNGFKLVLADVNSGSMVYISNRPGRDPVIQTVAPGVHVLSNAAIDSSWPKARYGTRSMVELAAKLDGEVTFYERYLENTLW